MTHGLGGSPPFSSCCYPPRSLRSIPLSLLLPLESRLTEHSALPWLKTGRFFTAQSPYLVNRVLYFVTARLHCASSQALVTKGDQDSNRLFLYLLRFRFHFYSSPFVYFFLFTILYFIHFIVYTKNLTGSFNTSRASSTFSKSKCMAVIGVATAPLNKLAERY